MFRTPKLSGESAIRFDPMGCQLHAGSVRSRFLLGASPATRATGAPSRLRIRSTTPSSAIDLPGPASFRVGFSASVAQDAFTADAGSRAQTRSHGLYGDASEPSQNRLEPLQTPSS